jgi:transcriptional regulator with XRE-family HTH domain
MDWLREARRRKRLSQRELAFRAGISFRGYQLLERADHDSRISSLEKVARALGLPAGGVRSALSEFLSLPSESIGAAGHRISEDGADSWKVHLFDFVDAFRREPTPERIRTPPPPLPSDRVAALLAATVDALCLEVGLPTPGWVEAVPPLAEPWFVSGIENLKALALVESPLPFRRRNVFVLANFLERA